MLFVVQSLVLISHSPAVSMASRERGMSKWAVECSRYTSTVAAKTRKDYFPKKTLCSMRTRSTSNLNSAMPQRINANERISKEFFVLFAMHKAQSTRPCCVMFCLDFLEIWFDDKKGKVKCVVCVGNYWFCMLRVCACNAQIRTNRFHSKLIFSRCPCRLSFRRLEYVILYGAESSNVSKVLSVLACGLWISFWRCRRLRCRHVVFAVSYSRPRTSNVVKFISKSAYDTPLMVHWVWTYAVLSICRPVEP